MGIPSGRARGEATGTQPRPGHDRRRWLLELGAEQIGEATDEAAGCVDGGAGEQLGLAKRGLPYPHESLVSDSPARPPALVAQEFVEAGAALAGASLAALYLRTGDTIRCHGLAPARLDSPLMADQPAGGFPWGMPSLRPRRFVLVERAGELPVGPRCTVADLGMSSAVHLPLGPDPLGAVQLYWDHPVNEWDEDLGARLRATGGFLATRLVVTDTSGITYGRRRTDT